MLLQKMATQFSSKFGIYFKIFYKLIYCNTLPVSRTFYLFILFYYYFYCYLYCVVHTPEQEKQVAIAKNVKAATSPTAPSAKSLLPMPPGVNPVNSTLPPKQQNVPKCLPPPPTPPQLLQQLPLKIPPLPSSARPPLPVIPPPPPPTSLPPPPPIPNQLLLPPPPLPPTGFPPMFSQYSSLQNDIQMSYANPLFSTQPPNMIPAVSGQYRSHDIMTSMGVQYMNESGPPPRTPYSENYTQRENMTQQNSQPQQTYSEFEMQDSYDENRQNYIETARAFNRDSSFVGGSYGNGSQHYGESSRHYSESGQHYVDGGSQQYSDPAYQQFRGNMQNKREFNNRSNRPQPPSSQYQNRQVRNHPYQRR